jgi:phage-related protein
MPRTLPAGTQAWLAKRNGGNIVPVVLVDIQTTDGTNFFWSDLEGTYTSKITGASQFYNGWIKNGFTFTRTRDFTSNAGDLTLQNLSGNTIDRDVAAALKNHEFEGALCIVQLWIPLLDVVIDEFHCSLSEANPTEDEASFRLLQLLDPVQYFLADDVVATNCTLRYKSLQCGSTGAAATCDKLFNTCKDANHVAQERFNAVLTIVPGTIFNQPIGAGAGGSAGILRPPIGVGGNRPPRPDLL